MKNKILFVEYSEGKPLPSSSSLSALAYGCDPVKVTSNDSEKKYIDEEKNLPILVLNKFDLEIITYYKQVNNIGSTILVTSHTLTEIGMDLYYKENFLLDHMIADQTSFDAMVDNLRITLQKIIRNDVFGIDKYLLPSTEIFQRKITNSMCRKEINQEVYEYADFLKMKNPISKMISSACEELLMNVIYDAPVDSSGNHLYASFHRSKQVVLTPEQYSTISFGCDGKYFVLGVADPFGGFQRETFFKYVQKILMKQDNVELMDDKEGGAGLGVYKLFHSCHSLICNILPKQKTEVLLVVDCSLPIKDVYKMARSLHYFQAFPK